MTVMKRRLIEPKIYHNQQLINELNEMFIRIKCYLFELDNLKTSEHPLREVCPKPSVQELDEIMTRIILELQKDNEPMIKRERNRYSNGNGDGTEGFNIKTMPTEVLREKLLSMRYTKEQVQKETSRDAIQFIYGYSECINDLLEWSNEFRSRMEGEKIKTDNFPKIITICGSGRFLKEMHEAEERMTLNGIIVLMIGVNTKDVARTEDLSHYKPMLDELHLRKIDMSDEVFVVNPGGYIGESTAKEIAYAKKIGKPIQYLVGSCLTGGDK